MSVFRRVFAGGFVLGISWAAGCGDFGAGKGKATECTAGQVDDADPADCKQRACADGKFVETADDSEIPDDTNPCTVDACVGGAPQNVSRTDGEACMLGAAIGTCALGQCDVDCTSAADCGLGNTCELASHICFSCSDGAKNGTETDLDCGGDCNDTCGLTQGCLVPADCLTDTCDPTTFKCVSCADGSKNGYETDVDCGGPDCGKCADNKGCVTGDDCASQICTGGTCPSPTCTDGKQNGTETDVDCGGGCMDCGPGKKCLGNNDCTNNCVMGICN